MIENNKTVLVTGAAGFIGYHLTELLLKSGYAVIGLDNINDYYDVNLKYGRLKNLGINKDQIADHQIIESNLHPDFKFVKMDLTNREMVQDLFKYEKINIVCNLAAQAGVRYSIENPYVYIDSNITSFINLLECSRHNKVEHFVYASSSSVYGLNKKMPLSTDDSVDHPISLYAATKKSNELMAHTYSHLYGIKTTGLRFFTVYGPWGRPDMAAFSFTKAILNEEPIKVFNEGEMSRDFTYIDDVIEGISKVLMKKEDGIDNYKIYNVGNNGPSSLITFIEAIEKATGKTAKKKLMPLQEGDMKTTYADIAGLQKDFKYQPKTGLEEGIGAFVNWYKLHYSL